jgi:hypothetical protein
MRNGAVVLALLAAIVAGCEATSTPSVAPVLPSSTPATALATASPAAPAVATPQPTPKPTPLAVPAKPTGVKLRLEIEGICGDPGDTCAIGDSIFRLSWTAPRTKGVEIRVYGVTTCFGEDSNGTRIDGHCLREHTALPSSVRVLLAKAPASKGKVTWRMDPGERGLAQTRDGVPIHAIVLSAYNAEGGHSIFAIADAGDRRLQGE